MAGQTLSNWRMPPIPSSILHHLPGRLSISDAILQYHSVTHSSLHGRPANPNSLVAGDANADYEILEHVGDNVVGSAVIIIIHREFPWLKPGPSTALRGQICSNETLAQISVALGIPNRLRAHVAQIYQLRSNPSIQAAMFEAHIGALAMGDQGTIALSSEVSAYLENIFTPIVIWGFDQMRAYSKGLVDNATTQAIPGFLSSDDIDRLAVGAKNILDQEFVNGWKGTCDVVTHDTEPPFEAFCEVRLRNGKHFETSAIRMRKKLAYAAASWAMCGELGLPRREA